MERLVTKYTFNVHNGAETRAVTQEDLSRYADLIGLSRAAPCRYSWLFALDLYVYEQTSGIEPMVIVEEIKRLESGSTGFGTKRAAQFQREPLRGFWHKHFFSARFIGQNLLNELRGGRLETIAREVFDPKRSPVVTNEMIREFSRRVVTEPIERRDAAGKLTGEWIIFAKHEGLNYYLCIATHTKDVLGDQAIHDRIKLVCLPQFPFLFSPRVVRAIHTMLGLMPDGGPGV